MSSVPPSPSRDRAPVNGLAESHLPRVPEGAPLYTHSQIIRELRLYSTDKAATNLAAALTLLTLHPSSLHPALSSLPPSISPSVPTLLSLLYTNQRSPPPSLLPRSLQFHASSLLLLHVSFYLHQHLLLTVLDLLLTLHPHVSYWERIDAAPHSVFASINRQITAVVQLKLRQAPEPASLASASASAPLSNAALAVASPSHKLRRLLRLRKVWTTRAGRLAYRAHRLRYWLCLAHSSDSLPLYVDRCTRYVRSLYAYVSGHPPSSPSTALPASLLLLEEAILGLDELREWFHLQLAPLRKPSHLQRHWLRYLTLASAAVVGGHMVWKRRMAILSYVDTTWASLSLFAQDHLVEPLSNIYSSVFSTFTHRSTLDSVQDQLRESEAVLSGMLSDYGLKRHHSAADLARVEEKGDMSLVMKDYREGIQHPFYALAFRDLLQQFLIQVQQVKVSGEAAMVTMDQLLSANAINFDILATIPAVLLGLLLAYAVRDVIVRLIMRGSDRSSVYEAVRRRMRAVETLCIQYVHYGDDDQPRYRHTRALHQWREKEEMRERGEEDEDDEAAEEEAAEAEETAEEAEEHHEDSADANAHPTTDAIDIVSPQYLPSWAHGQVLLHLHSLPAVHNLLDSAERIGWGRSLALLADVSLTPRQKVRTHPTSVPT